jgi:4-hydroxy-tetrahydrodipicolinate synthase
VNPVPVKSLMRAVGLPAGPLRRPLSGLDPAALARGIEVARGLGLDRRYGYRLDPAAVAAE